MFSINNCESERKFIQNFNNKLSYEATTFTSCAMFWIKERVKELTIREHNFDNEDSFIPVSSTKKVDEVVVCIVDMANQACFFAKNYDWSHMYKDLHDEIQYKSNCISSIQGFMKTKQKVMGKRIKYNILFICVGGTEEDLVDAGFQNDGISTFHLAKHNMQNFAKVDDTVVVSIYKECKYHRIETIIASADHNNDQKDKQEHYFGEVSSAPRIIPLNPFKWNQEVRKNYLPRNKFMKVLQQIELLKIMYFGIPNIYSPDGKVFIKSFNNKLRMKGFCKESDEKRDGDWVCPKCGYTIWESRNTNVCFKCKTHRT